MRELKSALYTALSLGMLIYAMPRLEVGRGFVPETLFGVAWISIMLLIIAAHLRIALRVDEPDGRREDAVDLRHIRAQK